MPASAATMDDDDVLAAATTTSGSKTGVFGVIMNACCGGAGTAGGRGRGFFLKIGV